MYVRIALAAAAMALCAAGCSKAPEKKEAPPPQVATTVASEGDLRPNESLPGLVAPFQNVAIQSTLSEPAIAINVQEGDRVRKGEVIAVLDTADLRAQLEADIATANGASANATHTSDQGRLTIVQSQQTVLNAQASLVQARQTLAKDNLDLARYKQLLGNGYIAEQQVSQQATLVRNDEAAVQSAAASLQSDRDAVAANGSIDDPSSLQASSVEQAVASEKSALAQADQVRAMIAKATIVSPIDGVVVNRNLNPGEYPGSRQIFTLQQVDPIYAVLHASGEQVADVPVGATAVVKSSDLRTSIAGKVDGVLNQVNPGSTDFQVKVLMRNPNSKLRPGMAVTATVTLPPIRGVRVPITAFLDDNRDSVMVVGDDSKVKTQKVTYTADDGTTAIVTGVTSGQRVINDGQTSVGDGQVVAAR